MEKHPRVGRVCSCGGAVFEVKELESKQGRGFPLSPLLPPSVSPSLLFSLEELAVCLCRQSWLRGGKAQGGSNVRRLEIARTRTRFAFQPWTGGRSGTGVPEPSVLPHRAAAWACAPICGSTGLHCQELGGTYACRMLLAFSRHKATFQPEKQLEGNRVMR